MDKVKILVMGNNSKELQAIRNLIKSAENFDIVGEVHSKQELVENVKKNAPDIVLINLMGLELDGLENVQYISNQYPSLKILILIQREDRSYVLKAIKAGIDGYVTKNELVSKLVTAIRIISQGNTYLYHSSTKKLIESYMKHPKPNNITQLTLREQEILKLVVAGYTSRKISEKIGVPVKTVQNYRLRISKKLKTKNLASLIRYAMNTRLMDND